MGKVNPNKRPASEADVRRAYKDGLREGFKLSLDLTLHALVCDMEISDEDLDKFNHYFNALLRSYNDGTLKRKEIVQNMMDEKGMEVIEI